MAHTLDSADRHGVMAAGFSFGQSEKARSLGYEKEKSPTIRGGEGGNQKPVVLAFAQNQMDEVRDLKECSGSLAAEPGAKQQTYVMAVDCRNGTESPDTNGTLQAKDSGGTSLNLNNVVRTSGGAMNPWDAQSARIYGSEGAWHSLNANENGGQSRDAVLVESSS